MLPSFRVKNTTVNAKAIIVPSTLNVTIRNTIPHTQDTKGLAVTKTLIPASIFGAAGYPIGILLTIPYVQPQNVAAFTETLIGFNPHVRIHNG